MASVVDSIVLKFQTLGARAAQSSLGGLVSSASQLLGRFKVLAGAAAAFYASFKLIKSGLDAFVEFEEQMTRVKALTQATGEQFDELQKKARELGATTTFTATESAQSLFRLSQAGFSVQESLETVESTLRLAQVGFTDLDTASAFLSKTLRQFNLEAAEAERVVNLIAFTANKSLNSVNTLEQAFGFSATTANNFGISIEQLGAILGRLGNVGIQSGKAGRGFTRFLQSLVKLTPEAKQALADYGITTQDVSVAQNGFFKVIQNLDPLLKANANSYKIVNGQIQVSGVRTKALTDLYKVFGAIPARIALALGGQSTALRDVTKASIEQANFAKNVQLTLQEATALSIKELSSAWTEYKINLGEGSAYKDVIKFFTGVISSANGMLDAFLKGNPEYQKHAETFMALGNLLKSIGLGLKALKVAFFGFLKDLSAFVGFFSTAYSVIEDFWFILTTGGQQVENKLKPTLIELTDIFTAGFYAANLLSKVVKLFFQELIYGVAIVRKLFSSSTESVDNFNNALSAVRGTIAEIKRQANFSDFKKELYETQKAVKKTADESKTSLKVLEEFPKRVARVNLTLWQSLLKNFKDGALDGLKQTETTTELISSSVSGAITGLEDSFLNFFQGQKDAWKELAVYALRQIARIALRKAIIEPLVKAATNYLNPNGLNGEKFESSGGVRTQNISKLTAPPIQSDGNSFGTITSRQIANAPDTVNSKVSTAPQVTIVDNRRSAPPIETQTSSSGKLTLFIKDTIQEGINNGEFDNSLSSSFGSVKRRGSY